MPASPRLVLGPLLRRADPRAGVVWCETDAPCEVEVLGARERTFQVHGHHYAVVVVEGLEPGSETPYAVRLDGRQAWPLPCDPWPPPLIRTPAEGGGSRPVRVAFGSCRQSPAGDTAARFGPDALAAYAEHLRRAPSDRWPDVLLMVGDQLYADEVPPALLRRLRPFRRGPAQPPGEIGGFEAYAALYTAAWTDPAVRWLLSTVPSAMVFDDHDVRDDWNTSQGWRDAIRRQPWWRERIVGAFATYWIYQHLGNLSPDELASDPLLARLRTATVDGGPLVDAMAAAADDTPSSRRWGHVRDVGDVRLLVLDTRADRVLTPGARRMLSEPEWRWAVEQTLPTPRHLLIGASVPWLLLPAISDAEGWSEAAADGRGGRLLARVAERLRLAIDLEHFGAFRRSFLELADLLAGVAARPDAPRTVAVLSGDVHYSYAARARWHARSDARVPVWQLVCSPFRNSLSGLLRHANVAAQRWPARLACRVLARSFGVPDGGLRWGVDRGLWFENAVAEVWCGEESTVTWWTPAEHRADLRKLGVLPLGSGRNA